MAVPGLELGHGFRLASEARNPGFGSVCGGSGFSVVALTEVRRIARTPEQGRTTMKAVLAPTFD